MAQPSGVLGLSDNTGRVAYDVALPLPVCRVYPLFHETMAIKFNRNKNKSGTNSIKNTAVLSVSQCHLWERTVDKATKYVLPFAAPEVSILTFVSGTCPGCIVTDVTEHTMEREN